MKLPNVLANGDLRKSRIALVAALFVAALGGFAATERGAYALSQLGIRNSVAQTMVAAEQALHNAGNALNSFIARSPGERGATDILKGKAKRLALQSSPKPQQVALGKVFEKPLPDLGETAIPAPVVALLPETGVLGEPIQVPTQFASVGPNIYPPVIGVFGGGSGFGGGGGGGGGGGFSEGPGTPIVPPTEPPVTSPVPEPSTWALLLFGFGAIGASLRRAGAHRLTLARRAGHCAKN